MKKFLYILGIIFSLFIGIIGTIIVYKFIPSNMEVKETTIKDYNISEINSLSESINKIYNAVVFISSTSGRSTSTGTGFVYKVDDTYGYIITNNHVIEGADNIEITNIDEGVTKADVLGRDEYSDLAVLRIEKEFAIAIATLGESTNNEVGDTIFTVGSPLGKVYMNSVSKGIISGKNRTISVEIDDGDFLMDVIQIDASINPGNSGGPLCNVNGEVIGVNSMKLVDSSVEGMGFAIPIEIAKPIVEKLEKGMKISRPYIGMDMLNTTDSWKLYRNSIFLDESIKTGAVVLSLDFDSPFYTAGFKKGYVITKINGIKVETVAEFRYLIYKESIGNTIEVTYLEDNIEKTKKVNLIK